MMARALWGLPARDTVGKMGAPPQPGGYAADGRGQWLIEGRREAVDEGLSGIRIDRVDDGAQRAPAARPDRRALPSVAGVQAKRVAVRA